MLGAFVRVYHIWNITMYNKTMFTSGLDDISSKGCAFPSDKPCSKCTRKPPHPLHHTAQQSRCAETMVPHCPEHGARGKQCEHKRHSVSTDARKDIQHSRPRPESRGEFRQIWWRYQRWQVRYWFGQWQQYRLAIRGRRHAGQRRRRGRVKLVLERDGRQRIKELGLRARGRTLINRSVRVVVADCRTVAARSARRRRRRVRANAGGVIAARVRNGRCVPR